MNFFEENKYIRGVIFDVDGLLVNSEPLSCYALNVIFEKHFNIDIGTDYSQVLGKNLKDSLGYYFKKFKLSIPPNIDIESLYRQKDQTYKEIARNRLQPFPGVLDLLEYLHKSSLVYSVASSGTYEKIMFNLQESGLERFISIITSADEVTHGKPQPDLFLLSAKKLHVEPTSCIVLEDSVSGIKAAKAAQMMAIAVTNSFSNEILLEAGADKVISRLDELL